ncbi:MAG: HEAT repeat domain-containing protein [Planctomycetes bacterium]|nr:HEAT repeat domain-containing protein [Planctomycetota bacterium]
MRWIFPLALLGSCVILLPGRCVAESLPGSTTADEQLLQAANVPTDGPGLLDFFRKRTLPDAEGKRIQELIHQLGDDSFETREKACHLLVAMGTAAVSPLRQAAHSSDLEVAQRAEKCLKLIESGSGATVPAAAARLLARRNPPGATEVLLAYLPFAENEIAAKEVRASLAEVGIRDGKVNPALVQALSDKVPARRSAAAAILWKAGSAPQRAAARQLLQDPDTSVRLQVALALAESKEKEALPVLIDLLGELPQPQGWKVVDFLSRLAGEQAPSLPPGNDESSRRRCRTAWSTWWARHGADLDLARLDKEPQPLGYTMIVLLDRGVILEQDSAGKTRWQIEGLQKPLDAQFLPGDRVLVAEQEANQVTERTLDGKIVWKKEVLGPLVAQRLANGNTFIATQNDLLEVDRTGKEVFTVSIPVGEYLMRAEKLPNGEIALVTNRNRFVRLGASGKEELHSFAVNVRTSGGRIDVLPNGRVVVPELLEDKVVEYDPQGNAIWEASIAQPIAAVRLPNGHTLVTSMTQNRAVELDRTGKEVWEYKSDTRVTRAWRR